MIVLELKLELEIAVFQWPDLQVGCSGTMLMDGILNTSVALHVIANASK